MKYLNLGCGSRFHKEWTNLDMVPRPGVMRWDLRQGIPFPEGSFDVVYHSHLLEHMSKSFAPFLLKECRRVLRSGGIIRIAVPDLEMIARLYLKALEKALAGSKEWMANYEWILLELYDQTVRNISGGEMFQYLGREDLPSEQFVRSRGGVAIAGIIADARWQRKDLQKPTFGFGGLLARFGEFLMNSQYRREKRLRWILGSDYNAYIIGKFRMSGEIHQWMYDRYSMAQLLIDAGFGEPVVVGPAESRISGWTSFNLDTEPDGTVYKPDSLFMEAITT